MLEFPKRCDCGFDRIEDMNKRLLLVTNIFRMLGCYSCDYLVADLEYC